MQSCTSLATHAVCCCQRICSARGAGKTADAPTVAALLPPELRPGHRFQHSADGSDHNLLILLHGLGDVPGKLCHHCNPTWPSPWAGPRTRLMPVAGLTCGTTTTSYASLSVHRVSTTPTLPCRAVRTAGAAAVTAKYGIARTAGPAAAASGAPWPRLVRGIQCGRRPPAGMCI